jgi:hypothetical protein
MSKQQDPEKARFWQRTIREAARSGLCTVACDMRRSFDGLSMRAAHILPTAT